MILLPSFFTPKSWRSQLFLASIKFLVLRTVSNVLKWAVCVWAGGGGRGTEEREGHPARLLTPALSVYSSNTADLLFEIYFCNIMPTVYPWLYSVQYCTTTLGSAGTVPTQTQKTQKHMRPSYKATWLHAAQSGKSSSPDSRPSYQYCN